ncbi:hypothetical protein V8B97DRAFT_1918144 [Scleroderma yunnanense]
MAQIDPMINMALTGNELLTLRKSCLVKFGRYSDPQYPDAPLHWTERLNISGYPIYPCWTTTFDVSILQKRSMSTVSLIYLVLKRSAYIISDGSYNQVFSVLQIWPLAVETWLMHIILQIRLYALYDRSKKVLFIMVLGFIIEVATTLVTMIRMSILEVSQVSYTFNQTVAFSGFLPTAAINIYVNYSVIHPSETSQIAARNLRAILIEGNVTYFLVILFYMLGWLAVSFTVPAGYSYMIPYFRLAIFTIIGCQIILYMRSAASQSSSSTNGSGQNYSFVVFRDPTHSSIYDDT